MLVSGVKRVVFGRGSRIIS